MIVKYCVVYQVWAILSESESSIRFKTVFNTAKDKWINMDLVDEIVYRQALDCNESYSIRYFLD